VTTSVTGRVLARLHRGLLRGVVWLAMLPLRAVVALLVWLGVARVAATVLFVGWAEPIVGLRSATWLVVIWWVHRLTRHRRAALYRHELLRRAERALERQPTALMRTVECALGRQVVALAGATRPRWAHPRTGSVAATRHRRTLPLATTAADHARVATTPQPAADQPPEQAVAALGRHAAAWVRRHTRQLNGDSPTRPDGRHPR
jgi:hypothetical protein